MSDLPREPRKLMPAEGTEASQFDHHMMGVALAMARRGLGRTAPNPSVGAVIVDPTTGELITRAVTAPSGRPHAEPLAIAAARGRARGATLYVTLEPCSHHGQTAPCADAIIEGGLARVVVGIEDPDPRVAGRGLSRLRAAGIAVTRGVRASEARSLTRGHILRIAERRPFVQLKLALSADGSVPRGGSGHPLFVTSAEARAHGHLLRAEADAILIGAGTLTADNPELTCRLPGLSDRSPIRVVLAQTSLDLSATRLGTTSSRVPVIVFCGQQEHRVGRGPLPADGAVRFEPVPVVAGRLWLPAVIERLAELGVTRLLVEGGPRVWRAFADAGLFDEIVVFWQHGQPDAPLASTLTEHLGHARWRLAGHRAAGPDRLFLLHPDTS